MQFMSADETTETSFFLSGGPDRSRLYSHHHSRWFVSLSDIDPDVIAKLITRKSFGLKEIVGVSWMLFLGVIIALVAFLFSVPKIAICFLAMGLFGSIIPFLIIYTEHLACKNIPDEVVRFYRNGKCLLYDAAIELPAELPKLLRYTTLNSGTGWSGSESVSSTSELDLVVFHPEGERVHKLIAYSGEYCLGIGKTLSAETGITLNRCRN